MKLPLQLIQSLTNTPGFDREKFEAVHASGEQVTSIRFNPLKINDADQLPSFVNTDGNSIELSPIPWARHGYYLSARPSFTFDPLFHAGCYYVQEASSMFLEQAIIQTNGKKEGLRVLDLSAAPGGKSTHIQSLITPSSLLVSNEVIRSRANILKDNIIKWGCSNTVVTCNDPKTFGQLESFFDLIVVDAPCSGSGLFRRDPEAIDEWSLNNVSLCSQRQQRILADILPALKQEGVLIYSTCSYSTDEDEVITQWLTKEMGLEYLPLTIPSEWGIVDTGKGYRFWPDKLKGEGFFMACFRKMDGDTEFNHRTRSAAVSLTKKELSVIEPWIKQDEMHFIRHEQTVYAWPEELGNDLNILLDKARVIYSGIHTGELMRDKLVPAHALAMSDRVAEQVSSITLSREQAILYLQRKEFMVDTPTKGWQLVKYLGHSLGWVNVLPNRLNNYYPKELRILKDH